MNKADVESLIDWMYWVNHRLLAAADGLTDAKFRAPSKVTTRGLRDTFVHELDVEWSWRENVRGKSLEESRAREFPRGDDSRACGSAGRATRMRCGRGSRR